jgi:uncharacterized membrane protein
MAAPEVEDTHLLRFRRMPVPIRVIYARPRTFVAFGVGVATFPLLPDMLRLVTRLLISWDVFVGLYLILAFAMMLRKTGVAHIRRNAILQDDGSILILLVTALGAFASIAAIVSELGADHRGPAELTLATLTIALSWATVHTTFALHYAHEYYRDPAGGLAFPGEPEEPDYWDFVYFSFVVGMTAQVSDVGITARSIRRTATAHGVISFVFNTALVALMVNIAASAI